MAGLVGARFPPIIHHLQVAQGLPLPLAQCSTLLKTWMACDDSGRALVHDLIKLEVKRLLQQVCLAFNSSHIEADAVPSISLIPGLISLPQHRRFSFSR
jgi:hypothetical protein